MFSVGSQCGWSAEVLIGDVSKLRIGPLDLWEWSARMNGRYQVEYLASGFARVTLFDLAAGWKLSEADE